MEKIKLHLFESIIGYVTLLSLVVAAEYTILRALPFQAFMSYAASSPASDPLPISGPFRFYSDYSGQSAAHDVRWDDTLFCDEHDGKGFVAVSASTFTQNSWVPDANATTRNGTLWQYYGGGPSHPADCYMRATMTVFLKYGIQKSKTVYTNTFRIE